MVQGARLAVRPDLPGAPPGVGVCGPCPPGLLALFRLPPPTSTRSPPCRRENEGRVRPPPPGPGFRSARRSHRSRGPPIHRLVIQRPNDPISRCHRNDLRFQKSRLPQKLTQSEGRPSIGPRLVAKKGGQRPILIYSRQTPWILQKLAKKLASDTTLQDRRKKGTGPICARPPFGPVPGPPGLSPFSQDPACSLSLYFKQPSP